MSVPETCPGCQRAVIDIRSPAHACEEPANGTPQRCAWRGLRQQSSLLSSPWPQAPTVRRDDAQHAQPTLEDQPAAEPPPAPADSIEALQLRLEGEKAARLALREQLRNAEAMAAEAQALRAQVNEELERKKGELARLRGSGSSGATPTNEPTTPTPHRARRARPPRPVPGSLETLRHRAAPRSAPSGCASAGWSEWPSARRSSPGCNHVRHHRWRLRMEEMSPTSPSASAVIAANAVQAAASEMPATAVASASSALSTASAVSIASAASEANAASGTVAAAEPATEAAGADFGSAGATADSAGRRGGGCGDRRGPRAGRRHRRRPIGRRGSTRARGHRDPFRLRRRATARAADRTPGGSRRLAWSGRQRRSRRVHRGGRRSERAWAARRGEPDGVGAAWRRSELGPRHAVGCAPGRASGGAHHRGVQRAGIARHAAAQILGHLVVHARKLLQRGGSRTARSARPTTGRIR